MVLNSTDLSIQNKWQTIKIIFLLQMYNTKDCLDTSQSQKNFLINSVMLQTAKLKKSRKLTVSDEHKQLSAVTGQTFCYELQDWEGHKFSDTFHILSTVTHASCCVKYFLGHHLKEVLKHFFLTIAVYHRTAIHWKTKYK